MEVGAWTWSMVHMHHGRSRRHSGVGLVSGVFFLQNLHADAPRVASPTVSIVPLPRLTPRTSRPHRQSHSNLECPLQARINLTYVPVPTPAQLLPRPHCRQRQCAVEHWLPFPSSPTADCLSARPAHDWKDPSPPPTPHTALLKHTKCPSPKAQTTCGE